MNRKIVLLAFVSVLLLSGCLPVVWAHSVVRPYEIVVATIGEPETVDPAWAYDEASQELIFNVYEPLIFFDVDRTRHPAEAGLVNQFVPSLATEWTISPDGLTYTFKIREGVKFHNGATLTTEDVEYSFERSMVQCRAGGPTWMILEPLLGIYTTRDWQGKEVEYATKMDNAVESFTNATGSYVRFNLVTTHPLFLTIIARSWAGILDEDWCIAHGDWPGAWGHGIDEGPNWTDYNNPDVSPLDAPAPVMSGTGPYRFDYWKKGVEWSIVRHVDYWGGWPAQESGGGYTKGWVERVTEKFIPEWVDRKLGFLAGDYDMVYVPRMHIPELILNWPEEDEEYVTGLRSFKDLPILACIAIFFNFNINPVSPYIGSGQLDGEGIPPDFFSDVDVRKGFAYSFDYDTYIREVYMGEATQPATPVIEGLPYRNPAQPKYSLNLTAAEEHFKAAGPGMGAAPGSVWTTGFRLTITYSTGNIPRMKACEMLKTSVESLNPKFHITVKEVDWRWYLDDMVTDEAALFHFGYMFDLPDCYEFLYVFMHSAANPGGYPGGDIIIYPIVDELIEEGMRTMNETRRLVISYELQEIYHEDCISVPLCQPLGRYWERDWVMGWYYNPAYPGEYFYHLWKGYLGDTDKDYDVDLDDLYNVLISYGLTIEEAMEMYGVPLGTDVDKDGIVDLDDLYWVLINYG